MDVIEELLSEFSPEELGGFASIDLSDPFDEALDGDDEEESSDETPSPQKTVRFTSDQWDIVAQVVEKIREDSGQRLSEGRCIELVCADYMSGIQG